MTPSQKRALDQYMANVEAFKEGKPLTYEAGEDLNLEELSPEELSYLQSGGYDSIATDSRYKDAELAALADLEERSKGTGLTKQDEADMFRLHQQVNSQNRGRVGAIKDNMAARGLGGSGMEAMLQLQSAQDAAEREALMAMEKAGQAQAGKRDATSRLGQLSSSLQGRDFDQEMAKRQAEESIKRFNAANRNTQLNRNVDIRNQATQSNWDRRNTTSDNNVSSANQRSTQVYNATQDGASMAFNAATEDANRKMLDEQERRRRRQAVIAGILGAGGAVAGGVLGSAAGPAGTVAGAGVGASAGQAFGNGVGGYAYGGIVGFPEDELSDQDTLPPSLPLDHPANDVVPAKLSKGEVVVPRSVVADTFADPTNQSLNEYMNRLKAAVVEKQKAANDAKTMDQVASYGSIFTSLLNDFNAGRRRQAVLHNRMDQLGKAPTVSKDEVVEVKDLGAPMAKANLQEAKSGLDSAKKALLAGPEEYSAFKNADPSSNEAKQAGMLLKAVLNNKAAEADRAGDKETANMLRQQANSLPAMSVKDTLNQYGAIKELDYKDVLNNMSADKRLKQQLDAEDRRYKAAEAREAKADAKYKATQTVSLRQEVNKDKQFQTHNASDMALSQLESAAELGSGVADQALITLFNRVLDPGSVVRESEFTTTANGGGLMNKVDTMMAQFKDGQRLTPAMRQAILDTARAIRRGNRAYLEQYRKPYEEAIKVNGLDRNQIFGTPDVQEAPPAQTGPSVKKQGGAHGSDLPD